MDNESVRERGKSKRASEIEIPSLPASWPTDGLTDWTDRLD